MEEQRTESGTGRWNLTGRDEAFTQPGTEEEIMALLMSMVPKRSGGTRFIHYLRGINTHLETPHFSIRRCRDAAVVVCSRSQERLPTGPDGQGGQEVSGCKGWKRDCSLSIPPLWAFIEPIHLY